MLSASSYSFAVFFGSLSLRAFSASTMWAYRNEGQVGSALQAGLVADGIKFQKIFVPTKLWNTNHRPEPVEPAFEASPNRLRLNGLDLYLIPLRFRSNRG